MNDLKKESKYYIKVSIITFIILFIILLGFYPGLVPYDGDNQWQQVQSGIIINNHPFFSTFFMLILSKLWNSVTIIILYQILLFAISWGYFCKVLKLKNKIQYKIMYIVTICIVLYPLTCLYSITLWKDILYTIYLFLCAVMLYDWQSSSYNFSKYKYVILGVIISMIFSYRHNGVIVAILLLIIFYIICIKKYRTKIIEKHILKKNAIVLITFIIMIITIFIPKKIILNRSEKKLKSQENYVESFSTLDGYMLWIMGAHIKNNNIKNEKDKIFLNQIIPLNEWKELYNPYLINSTHNAQNLNRNYLIKNNKKFEKLFIKYSLDNPDTILRHYLKSDSLLLNPVSSLDGYVYVYCFPEMGFLPKYTEIKPILPFIKDIYKKISDLSFYKPFIIFYEPAFVLYVSIIIAFILSKKNYGKKIWIFILPMILNTISLLPINLAQDLRYVYINYLTFYGLILMFLLNIKAVIKRTKRK